VFYIPFSTLRTLLSIAGFLLVAAGAAGQEAIAVEDPDWPVAQVRVASIFLPESEQELLLSWRNVKLIELAVTAIDLTDDPGTRFGSTEWMVTKGRPIVRCLTYETHTAHREAGQAIVSLDPRLPPGAYIVSGTARSTAGGSAGVSTAFLLVTDAHILVQQMANSAKILVSDVETGEPIANARIRITADHPSQPATVMRTGADGTAEIELPRFGKRVIAASTGSRQAYLDFQFSRYEKSRPPEEWRIHASTDRPAYRAGETVRWKIIARNGSEERWETPAARRVEYKIEGPSSTRTVLAQGTATLNAFGSFWGEVVLTPELPPGDYSIVCKVDGEFAGFEVLFELEESPHPALSLKVVTPEGRRYLPGDPIEASIEASNAAGPAADAEVEATVFRRPLYILGHAQKPSPFSGWVAPRDYYANDDILKVETLRTGADGRALLRVDTRGSEDVTYRIEARIVDAAGEEIRSGRTLNIRRHAYAVVVEPERTVVRPNARASVRFRLSDADGRPVAAAGSVEVRRRRGNDVTWTDETVLAAKVASGATGEAAFTFTPKKAGYYTIRWTSIDAHGAGATDRITGEAAIWVAGPATTELGYAPAGGLQVHVDRNTARAGESVSVLLVTPSPGRRVLFTSAAERHLDSRLLHLAGTVKLVQLALDRRHVPNFTVAASSIFKRELSRDRQEIVVPPDERSLTVEVKADRKEYAPGDDVTLTITTRDHAGKPVAAEVALAVTDDDAVTAVRYDYSRDLRDFFYNELRPAGVGVTGSVWSQKYARQTAEEVREAATAAYSVVAIVRAPVVPPARQPDESEEPFPPDRGGLVLASLDEPLRSDFRSTALWTPGLVTGANGTAAVRFTLPDIATTWRVRARAATAGAAFGTAVVYVKSGE